MTPFEKGQLLNEETYLDALEEYGDEFEAQNGCRGDSKIIVRC